MASKVHKCSHAPANNPYASTEQLQYSPQHAELVNHTNLFNKTTYSVENVHVFVGWNIANITVVQTDNNTLVVVDTGEDLAQMEQVWKEFQSTSNIPQEVKSYPVEAVILTHHHADHVNGTQYLTGLFPNLEVWGADNLDSEYIEENGLIAPIMSCRAMAQYNNLLSQASQSGIEPLASECTVEVKGMNSGIGPIVQQGPTGYIPPTKLIPTANPYVIQPFVIGGTSFQVVYVPSEANSEIAIYLPERKVLLSAEVIQDHSFPNLYTLRGASFRDPANWSKSIDCFLENFREARHMILQHGPPILHDQPNADPNQPENFLIREVLVRYRDAIQYVRDQTLRWALKGYAKEEIAHLVYLPWEQENFKPWLQPFYGTLRHSIPEIYSGYIGWFDGDPVELSPLPQKMMAFRIVELIGYDKVMDNGNAAWMYGNNLAKQAIEDWNNGKTPEGNKKIEEAKLEWQYAAELATYLIRRQLYVNAISKEISAKEPKQYLLHGDPNNIDDLVLWTARNLKAASFRRLALYQVNANWHGTYLTAAHELEGWDMLSFIFDKLNVGSVLTAPSRPVLSSLDELAVRLIPEKIPTTPTGAQGIEAIAGIYLKVAKLGKIREITTDSVQVHPAPVSYECFKLHIRNGVLVYTETMISKLPAEGPIVAGYVGPVNILLDGGDSFETTLNNMINNKSIQVIPATANQNVVDFFNYFESGRYTKTPNIYLH